MTIKSKLAILPYFVIGSIIYFQFSLQQMYDKKLAKKLDEFQPQKISISDENFSQLKNIEESFAKDEPEATDPEEDEELSFEKELTEDESDYDEEKRINRDGSNTPVATRFRDRRHLLETGCSSMTPLDLVLSWKPKPWFLVSEKPAIIGCAPPRTASKEWVHMFRELDHLPKPKDDTEERKEVVDFVENIPASEGDQLLVSTAATRFIVVRHPFARIFAIWNSLFRENNPDGDEIFKNYQIARYVRTKPPPGYKISFAELCQFVSEDAQAKADPLFKPLTALCDPCANPFDFVAKFETLSEDANWLLIRANSDLKFPIVLEDHQSWTSAWKQLKEKNHHVAQKLQQLYYWDFRLFGYSYTDL